MQFVQLQYRGRSYSVPTDELGGVWGKMKGIAKGMGKSVKNLFTTDPRDWIDDLDDSIKALPGAAKRSLQQLCVQYYANQDKVALATVICNAGGCAAAGVPPGSATAAIAAAGMICQKVGTPEAGKDRGWLPGRPPLFKAQIIRTKAPVKPTVGHLTYPPGSIATPGAPGRYRIAIPATGLDGLEGVPFIELPAGAATLPTGVVEVSASEFDKLTGQRPWFKKPLAWAVIGGATVAVVGGVVLYKRKR